MPTTMQLLCPKLSYFNVHGCQELHYSQNVCLAGNYFTGCEFDKVQLSGGFQLRGFKLRHQGVLSARSSFFKNMFSAKRGFEILCQGFNWESSKFGRRYKELKSKVAELASLCFIVIWVPPPTDFVSPQGYMPRDLYNMNSRYGNMDELKETVKTFHDTSLKVLGDAVLNHRCAEYQNQNGVWNIFGGRLNWDERAVVADDPHFQVRDPKQLPATVLSNIEVNVEGRLPAGL
ncbi:hypothetical protein ACFX11_020844 [Malus domestica]